MIRKIENKKIIVILSMVLIVSIVSALKIYANTFLTTQKSNEILLTATAKVDAKDGAYIRKSASTSGKKIKLVKNNVKVTVLKEVFTQKYSTKKKDKWYYVLLKSGKKGYIRGDLMDTFKYTPVEGKTKDVLNVRTGAGTDKLLVGTLSKSVKVKRVLKSYKKGSDTLWYKIKRSNGYYYVCGKYIDNDATNATPDAKLELPDVSKYSASEKLNILALAMAWPVGTDSSKYVYNGGSGTELYSYIHSQWPNRTKTASKTYGSGPMLGASCDRFVGCVIWASGYDVNFPNGYGFKAKQQGGYMKKHPELWENIPFSGDTSVLQPGDVINYALSKDLTKGHSLIIVDLNGELAIAEASLNKKYPHINKSLKQLNSTKITKIKVYRAKD